MSILGTPLVADVVARLMQGANRLAAGTIARRAASLLPEYRVRTREIAVPTAVGPARAVVYLPSGRDPAPAVHVNFHGGGYVMRGITLDDPLCRYLASEAGVVVVNVDYAVAPRHRFPVPARQAFDVVRWVADHGGEHGWDGARLTVGGQSAGGGLAAAVARQALELGGPPIALQVLHYPPLDLAVSPADKPSPLAKPLLRPWMGEVFDTAYVPDRSARTDPLVSPANPADTADLTGIAPALVVTAELDRLREEGARYARRLRAVGALVEHHDVAGADHGYDIDDTEETRTTYALMARHVAEAVRV
ncbi:alpha/beta hydrolase fold domain-containing protein [Umezawaea sp.]|uniref:alpha/beta hydrolase fold domain-containing protein n=1 Tax=Umezawaea sp. TaxID=1955258 RepID=UPI002ED6AA2F